MNNALEYDQLSTYLRYLTPFDDKQKVAFIKQTLQTNTPILIKIELQIILLDLYFQLKKYTEQHDLFESIYIHLKTNRQGEEFLRILSDNILNYSLYNTNHRKALKLSFDLIDYANEYPDLKNSEYYRIAHNRIGIIFLYGEMGNFTKALKYFKKAYHLFEQQGDHFRLAQILINLGVIYQRQENYLDAISYFESAREKFEFLLNTNPMAKGSLVLSLVNIFFCYIHLNQIEEGRAYLQKIEALGELPPNISNMMHQPYGLLAFKEKNYTLAIERLNLIDEGLVIYIDVVTLLGDIYFEMKDYEKAIFYYTKSEKLIIDKGQRLGYHSLYGKLANTYRVIGDFDKCIEVLIKKEQILLKQQQEENSYHEIFIKHQINIKVKDQELAFKNQLLAAKDELNEQLKTSNQELNAFAHRIAHDLREPLRMINSYSSLLERFVDKNNATVKEFLTYIISSSQKMNKMINALLDFASIDKNLSDPIPLNFSLIIDEAVSNLEYQFKHEQIIFTKEDLPQINGYETLTLMLFQNIIANAIKFKRVSPIQIHISCKKRKNAHAIYITDNGIGMKSEDKDRIFGMFSRLHSKGKYEGLGIGLATCKRIMEIHKGYIEVESKLNEGTSFILVFPK